MPRRIDPTEAARRRQVHRYAALRVQLRTLSRQEGLARERRQYETLRRPGSAIALLDAALAQWRAGRHPKVGLDGLYAEVVNASAEDRKDGIDTPSEFALPSFVDEPSAPRPKGRQAGKWLESFPDVLWEIWKEDRKATAVFAREDGTYLTTGGAKPAELPYRVRSGLSARGKTATKADIARALAAVQRIRYALDNEVFEWAATGSPSWQPVVVINMLRRYVALHFASPEPIKEAAARRALMDLGLDYG